ncbi:MULTISPECIES: FAD-dependent oxidoreductase [Thioclava]|uniref:D-amino-acid oxidase n=1 Tax=Thioclava litoralis TaxID=3076557 RepID=A0ABZ1E350_9RHOB|nr:FAD-dependent oxidoreductase [Thioclava sp. FTW29]
MSIDFTILGAGVAGLTTAQELTTRGARVQIIDPHGAPGPHGCSWWAGGMLAPHCESEISDEIVVRHGLRAADWWAKAGVPVTHRGTLVVTLARDRRELDRFARRTDGHCWLDAAGIAALEPDLADRHERGLFFGTEAHIEPRVALAVLREGLADKGVEIMPDAPHQGRLVDCRGLEARDHLPALRGVRGEMVVLRCPQIGLSRPVRLLHPRYPLYIVPRGNGIFMLGASQLEGDSRGPSTLRSTVELLNAAFALHPAFAEAEVLELGANARPGFADNIPRVVVGADRVFVNGLFRHGYLMSPALAMTAADYLLDGQNSELLLSEPLLQEAPCA